MIVDLFAGPGGWSEGLRMLSPELHATEIGIEWDAAACATRAAAGHRTIRTDIATYPTAPFVGKVTGLIASPPCQDFSLAGKGAGIDGERGQLVREVMRWAAALEPEWIACEQVPPVLPIWNDYAAALRAHGYSAWSGILNAADYGVPQTRQRAFLLASRVRPALPPEPTHAKEPVVSLFGDTLAPWVTMSQALEWPADAVLSPRRGAGMIARPGERRSYTTSEPAPTVVGRMPDRWRLDRRQTGAPVLDPVAVPCPTITGASVGRGVWALTDPAGERVEITLADTLTLQSFPADYPVQGNRQDRFMQVGNAVPPLLAAHVLAAVTGHVFTPAVEGRAA